MDKSTERIIEVGANIVKNKSESKSQLSAFGCGFYLVGANIVKNKSESKSQQAVNIPSPPPGWC